jgi:hypothetical protein
MWITSSTNNRPWRWKHRFLRNAGNYLLVNKVPNPRRPQHWRTSTFVNCIETDLNVNTTELCWCRCAFTVYCPDTCRTATRRQSHSSGKNVSRWQLLQSVTQIALKIHFVARRSCARMGMVRHGNLHIQSVQINIFCCETFMSSSLPIQDVQRNTFCCKMFMRSHGDG